MHYKTYSLHSTIFGQCSPLHHPCLPPIPFSPGFLCPEPPPMFLGHPQELVFLDHASASDPGSHHYWSRSTQVRFWKDEIIKVQVKMFSLNDVESLVRLVTVPGTGASSSGRCLQSSHSSVRSRLPGTRMAPKVSSQCLSLKGPTLICSMTR